MFLGQKLEAKVIFHERIVDSNESCCKKKRDHWQGEWKDGAISVIMRNMSKALRLGRRVGDTAGEKLISPECRS
jgi:hypothetical protein